VLFAQSVGQRSIQTIDFQVLNAELALVGRLVSVTDKQDSVDAVFDVEETLKGNSRDSHLFHSSQFSDRRDLKELFRKNKTARLLVIGSTFTSLSSKDLMVPTASGVLLREPDKVIEYIREVLRTHPGVNHVEGFRMPIPKTWNALNGNGPDPLIVPIDANLEKWAVETIRNRPPGGDYSRAIEALRKFFKSDQNIALLKSQLDDPTYLSKFAEYNNGIEVRTYDIRRMAYESLKAWGVEFREPVIVEEIPRFSTVETLIWLGRPTDTDIEKIVGAPSLKTLQFNSLPSDAQLARIGQSATLTHLAVPGITDSGVASLGEVRNLEELDLSMSRVSDRGLAILERLPNLKRLLLAETRITDDALTTLARFPKLESVNLTLTRTSKAGIAEFRRIHPNVIIEEVSDHWRVRADKLAMAAFNGDTKPFQQFLDMGDLNFNDSSGTPVIFHAVTRNQYAVVKLLLDHKGRVDILDAGRNTPLQMASRSGYTRIMKLLLDRGANVNHADSERNTALHLAAQKGSSDTIRLLLDAGALISARNREGLTPLDLARKYRNIAAENEILKSASSTQSRR